MSVGAESAGQSIATLYTLTACCKRAGIDPIVYLTDVLRRLGRDPDRSVEEAHAPPLEAARHQLMGTRRRSTATRARIGHAIPSAGTGRVRAPAAVQSETGTSEQ